MILRKKDFGEETEHEPPLARSILLSIAIGFGLGMYDGFFGPGMGTFLTLLFNSVLGLSILRSCGTTKVVNLSSNVAALVTYALSGNVLFGIGIRCTIFAILGNWVGSGLALKKGAKIDPRCSKAVRPPAACRSASDRSSRAKPIFPGFWPSCSSPFWFRADVGVKAETFTELTFAIIPELSHSVKVFCFTLSQKVFGGKTGPFGVFH